MKTTGIAIIVALGVSAGASANSLTMSFLGFGDSTVAGIRYNSNLAFNSRSDSSFTNITVGGGQVVKWTDPLDKKLKFIDDIAKLLEIPKPRA